MSAMESDPSQAELMCVCQRLNQLLITLKCKNDELTMLEQESHKLEKMVLVRKI
jgi:hypothetical protein